MNGELQISLYIRYNDNKAIPIPIPIAIHEESLAEKGRSSFSDFLCCL